MAETIRGRLPLTVVLLPILACGGTIEPMPTPHQSAMLEPCDMPAPALMLPILMPTDPSRCLPAAARRNGLSLVVRLSPSGEVVDVSEAITLCLTVNARGEVEPKYVPDQATLDCIGRDMKTWRFMTVATCGDNYAHVDVVEPTDSHRASASGGRSTCGA